MRKLFPLFLLLITLIGKAQTAKDISVLITCSVQAVPPKITLNWVALHASTTKIYIYRKLKDQISFGLPIDSVTGSATQYIDNNVSVNIGYEYAIYSKSSSPGYNAKGWIYTGINLQETEYRGKMLILYDSTFVPNLLPEFKILESDLIGDGWQISKQYVPRTAGVQTVKNIIRNYYYTDTVNSKAVLLVGHIAVPYSGMYPQDGHYHLVPGYGTSHEGAWAADVYYADVDTAGWTDVTINNTFAPNARNHNIPGDGKFDQDTIPNDGAELQVGRIDFYDMPAFGTTEELLLKRYLGKNHNYKHKVVVAQRRGLVDDNFGYFFGDAFSRSGWSSMSSFFGSANVAVLDYFTTLATQSYLFSYACGPGGSDFMSCAGVGTTTDFVNNNVQTVFTLLFGSYFGDWDSQNNFLRAPLASNGMSLASMWSGYPYSYLHHMNMGETIGYGTLISQNNRNTYIYQAEAVDTFFFSKGKNVALMGDPSLRLHTVAPVSNLNTVINGTGIHLSWTASSDNVLGYHIYKLDTVTGMYIRLNTPIVTALTYRDNSPSNGKNYYMVRAVLHENGTGSYNNLSQGIFDTINNFREAGIIRYVAPIVNSMCVATNQTISIKIKDNSTDSVNLSTHIITASVTVTGPINQNFSTTVSAGYLASGDSLTIIISNSVNFSISGMYSIFSKINLLNDNVVINDSLTKIIIVSGLPSVTQGTFPTVCVNNSNYVLVGGTPAGGTYSGSAVSAGIFNATTAGVGTHTITYSYTDGNTCTNTAQRTILVDPCTGIEESDDATSFLVYPNPTAGEVTINIKNTELATVFIYNAIGQKIRSCELKKGENKIILANESPGIYFLQINYENGRQTAKLLLE